MEGESYGICDAVELGECPVGDTEKPDSNGNSVEQVDDSDYLTYCQLFVNLGWCFLAFLGPRLTIVAEEYADKDFVAPPTTLSSRATWFDFGCIVWAGSVMIPLLVYKWRSVLPRIWRNTQPGRNYRKLALANLFLVVAFFGFEGFTEILEGGSPPTIMLDELSEHQQHQYWWYKQAAICDYVFTAATTAIMVYRAAPVGYCNKFGLGLLTLVLPNVGFLLLMEQVEIQKAQALQGGKTNSDSKPYLAGEFEFLLEHKASA